MNSSIPMRHPLLLAGLMLVLAACNSQRTPSTENAPTESDSISREPAMQPIVVEIYADLICPFCFIGTERLERAIASSALQERVVVRHRAFLLQPDMPAEGIDVRTYLLTRTGREPSELFGPVEEMARESGLALDLTRQPRNYPTLAAHALLRHAEAKGTQRALERALYRAHFMDASNISDASVLVALATPHGFTEEEVRRITTDPAELATVRADAEAAARRGVRGVPHFVIDGERVLRGAQSEANLRTALEHSAR